jgi:hypothetical protein
LTTATPSLGCEIISSSSSDFVNCPTLAFQNGYQADIKPKVGQFGNNADQNVVGEAYELCQDDWRVLLVTPEGQAWMEPVFAHLFDEDGVSLSGASEQELDKVLDEAAEKIPELIPNIFTYWKAQRAPKS